LYRYASATRKNLNPIPNPQPWSIPPSPVYPGLAHNTFILYHVLCLAPQFSSASSRQYHYDIGNVRHATIAQTLHISPRVHVPLNPRRWVLAERMYFDLSKMNPGCAFRSYRDRAIVFQEILCCDTKIERELRQSLIDVTWSSAWSSHTNGFGHAECSGMLTCILGTS